VIISRTPYRISFFGGGSDFPDWYNENYGLVLSASINKYIYISITERKINIFKKYRIVYSVIEETNNINNIKHPVIPKLLKYLKYQNSIEMHYLGDLPSRSGIGSSSAFVVGVLGAIMSLQNKKYNKESLTAKSIYFEQKVLKESVGSQDHICSIYGGLNIIEFFPNKKKFFTVKKLTNDMSLIVRFNKNLYLYYTNLQRQSSNIVDQFLPEINKSRKSVIEEIINVAQYSKSIFNHKNLDEFGMLLNETWKIKKMLAKEITNKKIDTIYEEGIRAGSTGGKILGGGGGGFILFYVPKKNQTIFEKKFNKLKRVHFSFENQGHKIYYRNNNENQ